VLCFIFSQFFQRYGKKGLIWTKGIGVIMAWGLTTLNETDFYVDESILSEITHVLLVNTEGASSLPQMLVASAVMGEEPVGYITSKHALVEPHRTLDETTTMWPIFRKGLTLFVCVNALPVISHAHSAQRNEWLFNYPPARDIAAYFKWAAHFGILTTYALNRLFDTTPPDFPAMRVDARKMGTDEAPQSLQSIWGWLPAHLFTLMSDEPSSIFIMPSETATATSREAITIDPADFETMCDLLRESGFSIPQETAKMAEDSYNGISSEAIERVKELMGSHEKTIDRGSGGMYQ